MQECPNSPTSSKGGNTNLMADEEPLLNNTQIQAFLQVIQVLSYSIDQLRKVLVTRQDRLSHQVKKLSSRLQVDDSHSSDSINSPASNEESERSQWQSQLIEQRRQGDPQYQSTLSSNLKNRVRLSPDLDEDDQLNGGPYTIQAF